MHRIVGIIAALLIGGLTQVAAVASSTSADNGKAEERTAVTLDGLGRGLKSAAKNVEKEIPKIGSAIGSAIKKITTKGSEKSSSQEPGKQNK
jgi:hypothetical protein